MQFFCGHRDGLPDDLHPKAPDFMLRGSSILFSRQACLAVCHSCEGLSFPRRREPRIHAAFKVSVRGHSERPAEESAEFKVTNDGFTFKCFNQKSKIQNLKLEYRIYFFSSLAP